MNGPSPQVMIRCLLPDGFSSVFFVQYLEQLSSMFMPMCVLCTHMGSYLLLQTELGVIYGALD